MAIQPCSYHGQRYRGAANHAYPAIVHGLSDDRTHLRLCDECFSIMDLFLQQHGQQLVYDESDAGAASNACWKGCPDVIARETAMVFVTAYPRGAERRDFLVHSCVADLGELRQNLFSGPIQARQVA